MTICNLDIVFFQFGRVSAEKNWKKWSRACIKCGWTCCAMMDIGQRDLFIFCRSPGEGKGYPCQYSGLENSVHGDHKEFDTAEQLSLSLSSWALQFSLAVTFDSLRPMDCSTPGLFVHHQLQEFTQAHVHWASGAIQASHPLSSPSPPTFNLSQHQGLFKSVSSSHQVANRLCGSQQTVEKSSRDGDTRPPYLPPEKSVCRSRSNS